MTEKIKTRFAPSPSGYLHLGGARTALFAWAFARRGGGEFLLRIEDTDAARSDDRHSRAIAESLQWLGLQFDGEIAYQSRRRARHLEIAAQLSRGDDVFEDGGALRLRTPDEGETAFDDLVCGRLAVQNRELENPVLVRADKTPTYIFASAADDMDGGITHVIRGDDHIRNTHKQLHLYRALQKTPPHFAHLPMILGEDGARLSKRNAAVDVLHYRREGFLSRALMNYLARLSWSHGDAEKFDSDFLIRNFDFAKVSRSPAKFDLAKLKWLNGEYLRELPPKTAWELAELPPLSEKVAALILPRCETLLELREAADYFVGRPKPPPELLSAHLTDNNRAALRDLQTALAALPEAEWTAATIKAALKTTAQKHGLKFPHLAMPLRILLTGKEQTPDIAQVAEALGKGEAAGRMNHSASDSFPPS